MVKNEEQKAYDEHHTVLHLFWFALPTVLTLSYGVPVPLSDPEGHLETVWTRPLSSHMLDYGILGKAAFGQECAKRTKRSLTSVVTVDSNLPDKQRKARALRRKLQEQLDDLRNENQSAALRLSATVQVLKAHRSKTESGSHTNVTAPRVNSRRNSATLEQPPQRKHPRTDSEESSASTSSQAYQTTPSSVGSYSYATQHNTHGLLGAVEDLRQQLYNERQERLLERRDREAQFQQLIYRIDAQDTKAPSLAQQQFEQGVRHHEQLHPSTLTEPTVQRDYYGAPMPSGSSERTPTAPIGKLGGGFAPPNTGTDGTSTLA